jgi:hypothetical protein
MMPHSQKFRFLPNICHRQGIDCPYHRGAQCDELGIESLGPRFGADAEADRRRLIKPAYN